MPYTSDDIRRITNGRGVNTASSSDSKKKYTADDIRMITNPQTTSKSVYDDYAQKATAPAITYDEDVISKYESMPDYNIFERFNDKSKQNVYNEKQGLKSQYDTEVKKRDLVKMSEYGLTLEDIKKLTEYSNNLNTHSKEEMSPIFDKAIRVQNETGINPYSYTSDFLEEMWAEEAKEHPVQGWVQATMANPIYSTIDMLDKGVKYASGKPLEVNPNLTRSKRQAIGEGIDSEAGKFAYDALNSYADMGVAMLLGVATGGGGLVVGGVQGLEKASDVTDSAINRNLTPDQIMAQGALSGVTTAVTEAIPYSMWAKFAKKGFSGVPKEQVAKLLVSKLAISFGEEASQEMLEEVADTIVDRAISGDNSEINTTIQNYMAQGMSEEEAKKKTWQEWAINLGKEGLAGGIGGLLFGGGGLAIGSYRNANLGQNVNREALTETINTLNPESESYKNLENLGGNLDNASNLQVGELVQQAYADASTIDKAKYVEGLTQAFKDSELGATMNDSEINEIVDAVVAEKRDSVQKSLLKNASVKEIIDGFNETEGRRIVMDATHKRAEVARSIVSDDATNRALKKSGHKVGVKTEVEKIKDVKVENGKIKIYTENGEVEKATLSPSDAAMVVVASGIENENERRAFVTNYDGKQNVAEYTDSFRLAYDYGRKGMGEDILREDIGQTINLPVETAVNAYVAGENETRRAGESLENAINESRDNLKGLKRGEFDTSRVNTEELTATQRAMYSVADFFSNLGVDVVLFNDNSSTSANGFYEDGKVWINLSAYYGSGYKFDKGYVLNTMSHEFTHWMESIDKEGFEVLKDAIKNYFGDEKYAELIADEQRRYEKNHTKEMSFENAESEVVARSCEDMLSDAKTFEDILMGVDKNSQTTIIEKFKEFLDKIGDIIKKILNVSSPSKPAQMLRQNAEEFEKVRKAWVENFTKAIQNIQENNNVIENADIEIGEDGIAYNKKTLDESWLASKDKEQLTKATNILTEALGVDEAKARQYVKDLHTIANIEANNVALQYDDTGLSSWVSNSEYGGNFDFSYLCPKRLVYTGTLNAIHDALKKPLDVVDFLALRRMLIDHNYPAPCSFCYVEASRRNADKFIKEKFLDKPANKKYGLTIENLTNADFLENLRQEWLATGKDNGWEAFNKAMNKLGNAKPKAVEKRRAYRGEILTQSKFKGKNGKANVEAVNRKGGLRFFAFSDFEVPHMLDLMQVITDMSVRNLAGFAYTKQKEFVEVFGGTGLKIDMSCVAKGVDEKGRIIFDDTEGFNGEDAVRLRKKYSSDVAIVCVVFTDEQVKAAMKDDRIDYILPFHASGWAQENWKLMGLPTDTKDFTKEQAEKKGAEFTKRTKANIPVSEYWDYSKSGRENAQAYLDIINERGMTPLFPSVLEYEGGTEILTKAKNPKHRGYEGGKWVLPKGKLGDGYFKLLIEQKMYDNNGIGAPQRPVTPEFDIKAAKVLAKNYEESVNSFPVANDVVDSFMDWREKGRPLFSDKVDDPSNEVDSEGRLLTNGQNNYFEKSKVRDNDGKLLRMFHGTGEEFYEFRREKIGSHGAFEGAGFNFTPSEARAKGYGGMVLDGYLNIENPLSAENKTISVNDLAKLIAKIDPTGDDLIANYARDTHDYGTKAFVDRESRVMARLIWQGAENDVDIYSEMSSASGGKTTLIEAFEALGYDGLIHYDEGKIKTVIAFNSNQFKDVDNLTPTDSPDRRYSLKDDGLIEKGDKTLGYTNERIDKLLSGGYYGSTAKNYAKAYIAYMSPDDFLKLTTGKNQRGIDVIKNWQNNEWDESDRPSFDMEKFADSYNYQPIQLTTYEDNDEVYGHEGRHRMWQLKLLGYERVPVLIFNPDNKYDKEQIDSLKIKPQWFQEADDAIDDSDRVEIKDLIPFSQGNEALIKKKFGEGSKADTLFSEKINDPIADITGYNKKLEAQNAKLKEDLERLNRKLRLQSEVTEGNIIDEKSLANVANVLLNLVQSKADVAEVREGLKDVYSYILNNSNGVIDYDVMMSKAYDVAKRIMDKAKPVKINDDYSKEIVDTMRRAKIKLTPEQEAEAKSAFGETAHKAFWGRLNISKEGRSLDSYWSEWAEQYPNIFDANTNPNDQVTELSRIYDDMREASTSIQTFNSHSDIMAMAEEVYNKFWLLKTETTVADKYASEIKRINHEHRNAMKEVKNENQKQLLADAMHYGKIIAKVRANRDARIADLKVRQRENEAKRDAKRRDKAERRKLILKITEVSKDLGTRLAKNSAKNPVPKPIQAPLRNLLNAIDFSSKQLLGIGNRPSKAGQQTKADVAMSYLINKLNEGLEDIQNDTLKADDNEGNGEATARFAGLHLPDNYTQELSEIANRLQEAENAAGQHDVYTLQLMSTEDLATLYKVVKGVKTAINNLNKIISTNNAHEVDYIGHEIMRDLSERGQKRFDNRAFNFMEVANKTPYYYFKHLGEGGKELFSFLQNGWDKLADNVEVIRDYSHKLYTAKEAQKWDSHINTFEIGDRTIYITDAQLMSLYCLSKREQAIKHIVGRDGVKGDGIIIDEIDAKGKKIPRQDVVRLTESDLNRMLSVVENDSRMKEVADGIQEFMNTTCSAWGNEVTNKLYGIDSFTEKNYFPIEVNKDTLNSEPKEKGASIYGMLNQSFTKPLVENARNEINIANIFDVFVSHTESMAKYNALALPILDVIKVWNYKEITEDESGREVDGVKKAISKALGKAGNSYISGLLRDLNGDPETGRYDSLWTKFTKKYKTAAVAANVQTALLQPLAYIRAAYMISPTYLGRALAHKPQIKKCIDNIGVAKWKSMGFYDTNLSYGLDKLVRNSDTVRDEIVNKSLWLTEKMDEITWGYLYNAVEIEQRETKHLTGAKLDEAVAERLRDIIYGTQVFDSTLSRSAIMRSKSTIVQMETAFMAEPTLSINMLMDATTEFANEAKKRGYNSALNKYGKTISRAALVYLVSSVVESALRGVIGKIRDYDDDEEEFEGLFEDIMNRTLHELNVLEKIPYLKDIFEVMQGYNVTNMNTAFEESTYKAYQAVVRAMRSGKWTYKTYKRIFEAASQISGLPIGNLTKEFKTIWNNTIGRATGNYIK